MVDAEEFGVARHRALPVLGRAGAHDDGAAQSRRAISPVLRPGARLDAAAVPRTPAPPRPPTPPTRLAPPRPLKGPSAA